MPPAHSESSRPSAAPAVTDAAPERSASPLHRITCLALGAAMTLFVIIEVNFTQLTQLGQLALFAMGAMVLAFLLNPTFKTGIRRWFDVLPIAATIFCCGYLVVQGDSLGQRAGTWTTLDTAVGITGIVLLLEVTRRSIGWSLPLLSIAFIIYGLVEDISLRRIAGQTFLRTEGVFGTALRVMFTHVYLFVVFGAFLSMTGATQFIIDLTQRLLGRQRGGAAKVSVVGSGLMGSLSGSAVANAAITGVFTIPMMRSIGFRPHIAGGIEAASSSGGALVPPVMGAGAFMMLEILGGEVTYVQILKAALIPAILYYLSIFLLVHFYAHRIEAGTSRTTPASTPWLSVAALTFIIALGSLIWFLLKGQSPYRAVTHALFIVLVMQIVDPKRAVTLVHRTISIGVCIGAVMLMQLCAPAIGADRGDAVVFAVPIVLLAGLLHRAWRQPILDALATSARGGIPLVVAAACVGIILGMVMVTGLGTALVNYITPLADRNLFLALVALMICSIILGMGLPSAVSYLLLAVIVGPTLGALGVPLLAAHFFIFYFGLMAMVTPPVALAAYATATIAGAPIMQTGLAAFRFSLVGFTLPFMFIYRPELLLLGPEGGPPAILDVVLAVTAAGLGITALAAAMAGYLFAPLPSLWRGVLFAAAGLALFPDQRLEALGDRIAIFDLLGVTLLIVAATVNWLARPANRTVDVLK